jgi:acetyl esterase
MINKHTLYSLLIVFLFSFCSTNVEENTTDANPFQLLSDVKWASPEGHDLHMDIYTPNGDQETYPVIVMFHGGGWLINNKSIMNDASKYLASNSKYVVCNVDYRLLVDQENTVTMNEIVEDALGAVLWVKENISKFKGDPTKVIVTGDSAGGHLAMMVLLQGKNLSTEGFDGQTLGFNPTYLPPNTTAEQIAEQDGLAVQAAMISYGAFDIYASGSGGFESSSNVFWGMAGATARGIFGDDFNSKDNPELYKQVSPAYLIPDAETTSIPATLFTVGSEDNLTTPSSIQSFMEAMKEKGHENIQYWEHAGRPHAFLDSGKNAFLGIEFEKDAIPALNVMIKYLDSIFYN